MKLNTHKAYYLVLAALFIALAANPLAAEVYKVVDKDGNVTFTDQPPGDGTKPMELAPLSVVETPVYETQVEAAAKAKAGEDEPLSSRELRKLYRDFSIVARRR